MNYVMSSPHSTFIYPHAFLLELRGLRLIHFESKIGVQIQRLKTPSDASKKLKSLAEWPSLFIYFFVVFYYVRGLSP